MKSTQGAIETTNARPAKEDEPKVKSDFRRLLREGFADLAFIPRKGVNAPAIVAELKYNKSAEGALKQIKDRNYTDKLMAFSGEILLVGINYDKESKEHECVIEKIIK